MTKLKVAFQMDELNKLNFNSDSTYMLMQEAYNRDFKIYFYSPKDLSWVDNKVVARAYCVREILDLTDLKTQDIPIKYNQKELIDLAAMDFIFLRQDPPFDMAYITSTFLLEKLMDKVNIVNNPISVRNSPEKLLVTEFYEYMPKTIISSDYITINQFLEENGSAVIKPLYGNAGSDVFFLRKGDFNAKAIIEYFLHTFKEQIMVQEFIENVKLGDKRVVLIDGEPYGCINRIPKSGEIKSNLAAGGRAEYTTISDRDREICRAIEGALKRLGLFFVGIDLIDGRITEINVTSPTGLRAIMNLSKENLAIKMWDKLLGQKN